MYKPLSTLYWFSKLQQKWLVCDHQLELHSYNSLDGLLVDYPHANYIGSNGQSHAKLLEG